MILAGFCFVSSACGGRTDPSPAASEPERFRGAVEIVAGEPVFESDLAELVQSGVSETHARERLRGHALLASAARRAPGLVPARALDLARRRAAVQLYLRDLRASADPPTDAELRARHGESGDPRPFEEARDELREAVEIERTFSRIVERVTEKSEALAPEVSPESLPDLDDLALEDAR